MQSGVTHGSLRTSYGMGSASIRNASRIMTSVPFVSNARSSPLDA